ncbi:MAG: hypothetical protein JXA19_06870 [Anaerolineales bacterium]|nr:hypothetical protein [Anaerolineales bacterium]
MLQLLNNLRKQMMKTKQNPTNNVAVEFQGNMENAPKSETIISASKRVNHSVTYFEFSPVMISFTNKQCPKRHADTENSEKEWTQPMADLKAHTTILETNENMTKVDSGRLQIPSVLSDEKQN